VSVYEAEVEALPDPDLFRDALFLAENGTWSAPELDATDALLLAVIRKIKGVRVKHG
jgi:hypothetical protein